MGSPYSIDTAPNRETVESPKLKAHLTQKEYCDTLRVIVSLMNEQPFLNQAAKRLKQVADSALQVFNVAIFGYMKTGKSSLINAFIGKHLAITGVNETTATINKITYGDGKRLEQFVVHRHSAMPEDLNLDQLGQWVGTSGELIRRAADVSHLELFSNMEQLQGISIIDTPGMGTNVKFHDRISKQFIKGEQVDAIVYVLDVQRRNTLETLYSFKETCLEGTEPYNSVAVLHKWDSAYWNNGGDIDEIKHMAQIIQKDLRGLVSKVLPVSAPLGLFSKTASDAFWHLALSVISSFQSESQLTDELMIDEEYWSEDTSQKELWQMANKEYKLPWTCFKVMLRELFRANIKDISAAKEEILKLSNLQKFEDLLKQEFFLQQVMIRLRQLRARATRILDEAFRQIQVQLTQVRQEVDIITKAMTELKSSEVKEWIKEQHPSEKADIEKLQKFWVEISSMRNRAKQKQDLIDHLLSIRRWMDTSTRIPFSSEQVDILKKIIYNELETDVSHSSHVYDKAQVDELLKRTNRLKIDEDMRLSNYGITLSNILLKYRHS